MAAVRMCLKKLDVDDTEGYLLSKNKICVTNGEDPHFLK